MMLLSLWIVLNCHFSLMPLLFHNSLIYFVCMSLAVLRHFLYTQQGLIFTFTCHLLMKQQRYNCCLKIPYHRCCGPSILCMLHAYVYEFMNFFLLQKLFRTFPEYKNFSYNKRQMSRIYPKGGRVDSSNYMPQVNFFRINVQQNFLTKFISN